MISWREQCAQWQKLELPIQPGSFPDVGIFGGLRWLMGDEECLLAFCMNPELVHEIINHLTDLYLTVFEQVSREVRIDVIHIWEDMAGSNGPIIGPDLWDEFVIIPSMVCGGMNKQFPLEVGARCDIVAMQKKYPELGMLGGIDKRELAIDKHAIRFVGFETARLVNISSLITQVGPHCILQLPDGNAVWFSNLKASTLSSAHFDIRIEVESVAIDTQISTTHVFSP